MTHVGRYARMIRKDRYEAGGCISDFECDNDNEGHEGVYSHDSCIPAWVCGRVCMRFVAFCVTGAEYI